MTGLLFKIKEGGGKNSEEHLLGSGGFSFKKMGLQEKNRLRNTDLDVDVTHHLRLASRVQPCWLVGFRSSAF